MSNTDSARVESTIPTVEIIGIPMFAADIPTAVEIVKTAGKSQLAPQRVRCISATGAHGLVLAQEDKEFRQILRSFFLNLPDGKPGVWVGRLKGAKAMQRCYGPDFFAALMRATASDADTRHYLCGGQPGVAEQLQEACARKFGNRHIAGIYSPPFRPLTADEYRSLGAEIDRCDAAIVWIGISTPKQERFAAQLAAHTKAQFIITVGAAFDFHTDRVRQAPAWMQQAGLEWLFRLTMEPKRLYRRYLQVVPAFIFYNVREFLMRSK